MKLLVMFRNILVVVSITIGVAVCQTISAATTKLPQPSSKEGGIPSAKQNLLEVGFGRASLWGSWKTNHRLADEVEVRFLVARSGNTIAAFGVADVMVSWLTSCLRLRSRVARIIGIPTSHVGIFATQTHGVPIMDDGKTFDPAKIDAAFVAAAREAYRRLTPVEMARIVVHPSPPLVFCRRVAFDQMGKFTFWFGFRVDDQGRLDCSALLRKALARLAHGVATQYRCPNEPGNIPGEEESTWSPLPVPEPIFLPQANDDLLQGLFFRTLDGRPVGSLIRFAAHPNVGSGLGTDWHSADYPAYVRRRAEAVFGGTSLFMTGPCGDQEPAFGMKSLRTAESIGLRLADTAIAGLKTVTWRTGGMVTATSPEVEFRIRPDYPESVESAKQAISKLEAQIKAAATACRPLAEIKDLSDRWELQMYVASGAHRSWTGLNLAGKAGQPLVWPLFVMRIGEAVIAGLPGEAFGGYSRRMRDETIGDALITSEEGNGYLGYLPTAAEYNLGGYGANASVVDVTAEDTLVAAVKKAINSL